MVRERVKNRAFHDRHIVPVPLEKESLSMEIYPASAPWRWTSGVGVDAFFSPVRTRIPIGIFWALTDVSCD